MTAIAYRDGIMAADSVGWTANTSVKVPVCAKIRRLIDGGLVAGTGETTDIEQFHDWMRGESEQPSVPREDGFNALWAKPGGTLWFCTWRLVFSQITAPFFAIGGPCEFMMGALFAGASADQAVRLAAEHTDSAGGQIQVEALR